MLGTNVTVLVGNIANDISTRAAKNGAMNVSSFTLAVNDKNSTDYLDVTCFGEQADFVKKYLTKGRMISVEGKVKSSRYTNKDGKTIYKTYILGNRVTALDTKKPTQEVAYQEQIDDPEPENENEEF